MNQIAHAITLPSGFVFDRAGNPLMGTGKRICQKP